MSREPCHCGGAVATEYLGLDAEEDPRVEYPSGHEWAHKVVTRLDGSRLRAYLVRCTECSSLRNDFEEVKP